MSSANTPAVFFAADLHITSDIWSTHPSITGDAYFAFEQIINIAVKYECPLVLAGDVLELMRDGSPSSQTVSVVRAGIEKLAERKIPLWYIHGQHDLAHPSWLHAIHPWAKDAAFQSFTVGGREWYGVPYLETSSLDGALEQIPDTAWGVVMHQRWKEFEGGSVAQGSLTELIYAKPQLRRLVTGDLHKHKLVRVGSDILCISPGATHKRSVKEPDQHSIVAITADGEVLQQQLKSRRVLQAKIQDEPQLLRVIARLPEMVAKQKEVAVAGGLPATLLTPLVIVTDEAGINSARRIAAELKDTAHVLSRNPKRVDADVEDVVLDADDGYRSGGESARVSQMMDFVSHWADNKYGRDALEKRVMLEVLQGKSLEEMREEFIRD